MTTNKLNTIEMTRRIREAIYEQIKDKTLPERLAFYRDKAQAFHRQLGIQVLTRPPNEPDTEHTAVLTDEGQQHREP
jgi:hypothetical protein